MEHYSEVVLMEFAQGRLGSSQSEAIRAHLTGCSRCASLLTELQQVHRTLGVWQPAPLATESRVSYQPTPGVPGSRRPRFWHESAKVAATIVIGAVVGVSGGYYMAASGTGGIMRSEPMPDKVAARMLHINNLEPGSATGLDLECRSVLGFPGDITPR